MDDTLIAILVLCVVVPAAVVGVWVGKAIVHDHAYKAGAGFWVCNSKTGVKRFAWVTEDKDEKEEA